MPSQRRQTRASVGSTTTLETPKQPPNEVTSPRTRSGKIISLPSPSQQRKSLSESPLRRRVLAAPSALSPSKSNLPKPNSPKKQVLKSPKTTPKKSVSVQPLPSVSLKPPAQLRSTRGTSLSNSLCIEAKKDLVSNGSISLSKSLCIEVKKGVVSNGGTSLSKSLCIEVKKEVVKQTRSQTASKCASKPQTRPKYQSKYRPTSPLKSLPKPPPKSPLKLSSKSPLKLPLKLSPKSPLKSPSRSQSKSPSKSPSKSQSTSPSKSPAKSSLRITAKISTRSQVSPRKSSAVQSPSRVNVSPRKRLLESPPKSPQSAKTRRLRGSPVQVKNEPEPDEDCVPLDKTEDNDSPVVKSSFSQLPKKQFSSSNTLPTDPELSGRFLRRKWFSLKSRGGFTSLRSAILSPEEIVQEVIQATSTEAPKVDDANFFTTKLMMRLSSRLPPTRARPSCEELVDLIKSKQNDKKFDALMEPKGESTAIRVKVERRSFTDTISQINSKPFKIMDSAPCSSKSELEGNEANDPESLAKKREREIALLQLKNLRSDVTVAKELAEDCPIKKKQREIALSQLQTLR